MKKEKRNYRRLYYLVSKVKEQEPGIDVEKFIQGWIWQTTNERTYHKSELTGEEYDRICREISAKYMVKDEYFRTIEQMKTERLLKDKRSAVLRRMQKIGIDTTDWDCVNRFLADNRIKAGKPFYKLTYDELSDLIPQLEAILKKQTEKQTV